MKYSILLLPFVIALVSCDSGTHTTLPPTSVNTTAADVQLARPTVKNQARLSLSGQLEAAQSVNISTRMMGFITSIPVVTGQRVEKGQILVRIHQQDLTAKKAQTSAALQEAQAALWVAEKDYNRYKQLFEKGSATAKELENMNLNYQSAKSREESVRQMAKEVDASMAYANLTAPFSGTITRKLAEEGDLASPGMPILSLEQAGDFQVQVNAPETDIRKVKEGQVVTVYIPAMDKQVQGEISQVSQSAKYSGGQYPVKIRLKKGESEGLYAGMYADVVIPFPSQDQTSGVSALWIPKSSVVYKDQMTGVYTLQQEHAVIRWIRVGKTDGDQIEVLSGLNSDDRYLLNPSAHIQNGSSVRVVNDVSH